MSVTYREEKVKIIGNNDSTISPHLKCWVKLRRHFEKLVIDGHFFKDGKALNIRTYACV
uniref:Uncharacterized protein n=1 Tax=uncultured Thiotrichaceae bacterium TaxID=298394 RepID=A0A6S6U7B1_9GAMM|nr:MAG: Unknown protein [uncultured Thiotrichaceae bacterium]